MFKHEFQKLPIGAKVVVGGSAKVRGLHYEVVRKCTDGDIIVRRGYDERSFHYKTLREVGAESAKRDRSLERRIL